MLKFIRFDSGNIHNYKNFIQSYSTAGIWHQLSWLDFQKSAGKALDGFFLGIEEDGKLILTALYLVLSGRGNLYYGYIPAGLLYEKINDEIYSFLLKNLDEITHKKKIVYTQIDSITPFSAEYSNLINRKNHNTNVKLPIPQYTNIIDLTDTTERILELMKPKGRYNIKLAEKKGVTVRKGSVVDVPAFYQMLCDTTERDGFRPNKEEYYTLMLEKLPEAELLLAYHEEDLIAAGIFTYTGNQALYYYGASSNHKRNLMAPYLVQWQAILNGKEKGALYYDFMGIADPSDKNDRLTGVTEFKLKFSDKIVRFQQPCHIIHNQFKYQTFQFLKKVKGFF